MTNNRTEVQCLAADLAQQGPGAVTEWIKQHAEDLPDGLLLALSEVKQEAEAAPRRPDAAARTTHAGLAGCHTIFRKWFGPEYDMHALNAVLATAAVERLDGDPVWLLLVSGPGNAKTETVQPLCGAGAMVASTIASEGALLSASAQKDKAKDATGGLLRKMGSRGVLVIKDVTSILSQDRNTRGPVLAALREVYDGHWTRHVGTDGGRTLSWQGRIAVVGAVTTAWDAAHAVISTMGDRFVLVRMDSHTGRVAAGRRAIGNTGSETEMRAELATAVGDVLASVEGDSGITVTDEESGELLAAADVVTLARTGVEYDYQGRVIDAHAPEMPTRFAKQLTQLVRGGVAVGMERGDALRLAMRCARDTMPPLRLAIVLDLAEHPLSRTSDVRKRLQKPHNTVDRQIQALHALGLIHTTEGETTGWRYSVNDGIELAPLR